MRTKLLTLLLLSLFLVSFASAEQDNLGTYTQGENIELLQICGTCTYNNITSIVYPNSSHVVIDSGMTKRGMEYTYTITETSQVGTYSVNGFGDLDGTDTAWAYEFEVTENGLDAPTENIIIFFSILFFIVFSLLIYGLYSNIESLANVDTNIRDVIVSVVSYFAFLSYYYFASIYYPKEFIMGILDAFLWIGGFTHLFLPLIAVIFTWIKTGGAQ